MKILFFLNIMRKGAGMINREMCFANELHRNGHEVSILSYFKPTSKVDDGISVSCVYPSRYIDRLYNVM